MATPPVALGFTTGLEVLCGGAAHAQPGAQTPASAVAAYNTPLTTLRGAGGMPDREDGTSGSNDDGDGSPSVRGQGHCGGAAVGGAAAEDALAEGEAPLAPGVVRLGGRTAAR